VVSGVLLKLGVGYYALALPAVVMIAPVATNIGNVSPEENSKWQGRKRMVFRLDEASQACPLGHSNLRMSESCLPPFPTAIIRTTTAPHLPRGEGRKGRRRRGEPDSRPGRCSPANTNGHARVRQADAGPRQGRLRNRPHHRANGEGRGELEQHPRRVEHRGCDVPIVADIHFKPDAAMEAAQWVEKVRVNPGNFADKKKFAQ